MGVACMIAACCAVFYRGVLLGGSCPAGLLSAVLAAHVVGSALAALGMAAAVRLGLPVPRFALVAAAGLLFFASVAGLGLCGRAQSQTALSLALGFAAGAGATVAVVTVLACVAAHNGGARMTLKALCSCVAAPFALAYVLELLPLDSGLRFAAVAVLALAGASLAAVSIRIDDVRADAVAVAGCAANAEPCACCPKSRERDSGEVRGLRDRSPLFDTLLVVLLGFSAGLMRHYAVLSVAPCGYAAVMGAVTVAAVALSVLWGVACLTEHRRYVLVPLVLCGAALLQLFATMPFADGAAFWLAARLVSVLYACVFVAVLVDRLARARCRVNARAFCDSARVPRCAHVANARPFGAVACAQLATCAGCGLGIWFPYVRDWGAEPLALVALVIANAVVLAVWAAFNGRVASGFLRGLGMEGRLAHDRSNERPLRDLTAKKCVGLCTDYGLSERESQIVERMARGQTVPYMASELGISQNTVRMHSKHIYAKLQIHKRQELMELIEAY